MTKVSLLLISALLVSYSLAAEKSTKRKKVDEPPAVTTPAPAIPINLWEPTAFNADVDQLPPSYQGLDPIKFLEMFKSKVGSLRKGEFETSEQFAQRTANKDLLLSPISTTDLYAFRISYSYVRYDVDTQTYYFSGVGDLCGKPDSFVGESSDWITCKVAPTFRHNDTYVGSNAFGASRTVARTRGNDFALAIARDSPVLSTAFKEGPVLSTTFKDRYEFKDRLSIPLEKARGLKSKKLAVLFVGRITDAKLVNGRSELIEPRIDLPNDTFISEEAAPFEVKKIIYYVIETGEILGQRTY